VNLRRGRVLRIGHKGAAALAPENTLRSFEAAIELGVDLVEFDVLELEDGTLVLAHSDDLLEVSHGAASGRVRPLAHAALREVAPDVPTLDEALEFLSSRAPDVGLHVDLKWYGYEQPVVEALRRHRSVDRALVTSCHRRSLLLAGRLEPGLALGFTYPFDRHGISRRRLLAPLATGALAAIRRTLPRRIAGLLARSGAGVAVLFHEVVSRAAVERSHLAGAAVLAWTVDDAPTLERVLDAGVDGVITNDPRILMGTLNP
jgi:glycerophosphoryl diester phosphodiesterase